MNGLAICLNRGMTVQDNWLANLKALVDANSDGADKRPGYRFVATGSGLSEEYVYQLYNNLPKADGTPRAVGPRAAKAIARAFANGRPHDWFDSPQGFAWVEPTTGAKRTPAEMARALSQGEPPPPGNFSDRHVVSESDWALLQDIKDAMASPHLAKQVEQLREELGAMKVFAENVYGRRIEEAQARGGHAGGMSVFGDLDEEPAAKPAAKRKAGK